MNWKKQRIELEKARRIQSAARERAEQELGRIEKFLELLPVAPVKEPKEQKEQKAFGKKRQGRPPGRKPKAGPVPVLVPAPVLESAPAQALAPAMPEKKIMSQEDWEKQKGGQ